MHRDSEKNRELEMDIAATRDMAERLSEALDHELRSQQERARASGAESSVAEVEADLADATARLKAVRAKQSELALRIKPTLDRIDLDAMESVKAESEALRQEAEPITAEIAELKALLAELRRPGG